MDLKWKLLAAQLLQEASQLYANHGCNDWKWPANWTPVDRENLADAMVRDNVGYSNLRDEDVEDIYGLIAGDYGPPDWWVMLFLSKQLAMEATEGR